MNLKEIPRDLIIGEVEGDKALDILRAMEAGPICFSATSHSFPSLQRKDE